MSQPPDPFEFLKSLWAPMGLPMAGVLAPTMDVNEIDKRIMELRSVENWLNMNLGALRMTIQGLEMQRSTLAAVHGAMAEAAKAAGTAPDPAAGGDPARSFAEAWWKMLQQQAQPAHSTGSGQAHSTLRPSTSSGAQGSGQAKDPEKK
jgi:hypothetical protein